MFRHLSFLATESTCRYQLVMWYIATMERTSVFYIFIATTWEPTSRKRSNEPKWFPDFRHDNKQSNLWCSHFSCFAGHFPQIWMLPAVHLSDVSILQNNGCFECPNEFRPNKECFSSKSEWKMNKEWMRNDNRNNAKQMHGIAALSGLSTHYIARKTRSNEGNCRVYCSKLQNTVIEFKIKHSDMNGQCGLFHRHVVIGLFHRQVENRLAKRDKWLSPRVTWLSSSLMESESNEN